LRATWWNIAEKSLYDGTGRDVARLIRYDWQWAGAVIADRG